MGDYTKLIVNCSFNKMTQEEIDHMDLEIKDKIGVVSSAYHCGGELLQFQNDWHHRTDMTLVTQDKYGKHIEEFIDWLKPQMVNGMGKRDCFAVEFSEYDSGPKCYYLE